MLWEQGVVGSNPATPTIGNQPLTINFVGGFFFPYINIFNIKKIY